MSTGWIGFDLDGTLAHYDGWKGIDHIGEPIAPMVQRLISYREQGKEVRIFTARCADSDPAVVAIIQAWCFKHIGEVLPVTNIKDYAMETLYDDRARQVELNTGRIAHLDCGAPYRDKDYPQL